MKKIFTFLCFALVYFAAGAQHYFQDPKNSEMLRYGKRHLSVRTEIVIPPVNGYNVYKADLHTHTIFSDGQVLPKLRVKEAWQDGLDIMAVTEHIEHRPYEEMMVKYMKKYVDQKYSKAKNNRIGGKKFPDEDGIMVDLNFCVKESQAAAKQFGLVIIPGTEITRSGTEIGHFNALFTKDNNTIYDNDPLVSIRNAKAQGALVMHNHPGWSKTSLNYTEVEKAAYDEGLIDGVEVMNGVEFYPGIIDRAHERRLFVAANTDEHETTAFDFRNLGQIRPMTLILAKDRSMESLREALEARRTLAFAYGTVCGEEQLLKDLFTSCVKAEVVSVDKKGIATVLVTNNSSIPYIVDKGGMRANLTPFTTISFTCSESAGCIAFKVCSMYYTKDTHPVVELKFGN